LHDEDAFQKLLRRVRARDEEAAAEMVRLYEPELKRIVRVRLQGPQLRRLLDTSDVCQSVLANFFVRAAAGQFDLDSPQHLLKLLVTMACNRVNDLARKQQARRRIDRRTHAWDRADLERLGDTRGNPAQLAAVRELHSAVLGKLCGQDRYLAEQRALGREWAEIAAELNDTPEALRKRLGRALDRAARELGLDALDDD
jgi:RNA polymerase sigma-70 factor (ECF subfamily)